MKKRLAFLLCSLMLLMGSLSPLLSHAMAATPTNLIANSNVETANSSNANEPADWNQGNWGTNSTTFSYLKTGYSTDTNSVQVAMTSYTSGDAKWYFNPVTVTPSTNYTYSDYYESTAPTEVVVQLEDASGNLTYDDLGSVPASSTWENTNLNFETSSTTTSVTVFHLLQSVGTLTTDDFSLTQAAAPTYPTVSVTAPVANATVTGTTTLKANASDTNSISNVQFKVDGVDVGSPVTTSPYSLSWNSTTVTNGTHIVTAVATNGEGNATTSAGVSISVNNTSPVGTNLIANPAVETASPTSATTPLDWQNSSWGTNTPVYSYLKTGYSTDTNSVQVAMTSYTSGDAKWWFNPVNVTAGETYNFKDYYEANVPTELDVAFTMSDGSTEYLYLGAPAASTTWAPATYTFVAPTGAVQATVYHLIDSVGTLTTSDFSLEASSAPTVSVTAPVANATVTGTTTLTASATDNSGIKNVQFQVDGVDVGSPVTTSPYSLSWNSATATNGNHTVTAIATNVNGVSTTSTGVSVNVSNAGTPGTNMIPNPLLTTANPTTPTQPENWTPDSWGSGTPTFSYLKTGYGSDPDSVQVTMAGYNTTTGGDAKWTFPNEVATQDTQYKFSESYKSTVNTEVDAVFNMSDGTTEYQIIGFPSASTSWTNFTTEFSVPEGTQTFTVYHLIDSDGTLTTDNYSLSPYTPTGFTKPLVTLTFDDGYADTYTAGLPLLQADGFTSTQFIITDLVGTTGYMTSAQVKSFYQDGDEIASHTVTHDDMTQETAATLTNELSESQTQLDSWTGGKITDIAYPYGDYDTAVQTATAKYYTAARSVDEGLNSKDNFNAYDIKVQNVYNTTTTAQVADWVAQAQATNTWLVIVYHSVDSDTTSPIDGGIYNVTPTQLAAQLAAIKASGVSVVTMQQAVAAIEPQL